jgi:hypothetical protein
MTTCRPASRAPLRESVLYPCPRIKSFPREMKKNKFPLRLDRGEGQGEVSKSKTFDAN